METENELLKNCYRCLTSDTKLMNICGLLNMERQLNTFLSTRPNNRKDANRFFKSFSKLLKHSFDNYWHNMIHNDISLTSKSGGNKLRTFRKFKQVISYEKYLDLNDIERRKNITKLRISAHKLRIETERFNNKNSYIPPEVRFCKSCEANKTEDELHFLIECSKYQSLRDVLFRKSIIYNKHFKDYNNDAKFIWLMSNENLRLLNSLGEFINGALKIRMN